MVLAFLLRIEFSFYILFIILIYVLISLPFIRYDYFILYYNFITEWYGCHILKLSIYQFLIYFVLSGGGKKNSAYLYVFSAACVEWYCLFLASFFLLFLSIYHLSFFLKK